MLEKKVIIEFFLKRFNCNTINYLCWERIPNFNDSIEEKVLRFIRSRTFTIGLEAIVTDGACEISSYIVDYVNIIKTMGKKKTQLFPRVAYVWIN